MKHRCISTHLHIFIPLCISASLCLNFLLDACYENSHLHMSKRSSMCPPNTPHPPFGYLFVYSSFALNVNNINVMVCCCRAGLNLHVSGDKDPKTEMLIGPTNQQSGSSARADVTVSVFTALQLHRESLIHLMEHPRQSPTGAGNSAGLYPRSLQRKTLIFMSADKGNYFLIAWRSTDTSGR